MSTLIFCGVAALFHIPAGDNIFLSKRCFDREFSSKNVKSDKNGMSLFSQKAQAQV
ncbi:hypothetical protein CSC02_0870 [Enterobacter hormaechei subsp. hoffmannii]|nr:hypothetical protein CSC02_0870 [Enterobacter hormaechei subsp. hoffmannii]